MPSVETITNGLTRFFGLPQLPVLVVGDPMHRLAKYGTRLQQHIITTHESIIMNTARPVLEPINTQTRIQPSPGEMFAHTCRPNKAKLCFSLYPWLCTPHSLVQQGLHSALPDFRPTSLLLGFGGSDPANHLAVPPIVIRCRPNINASQAEDCGQIPKS